MPDHHVRKGGLGRTPAWRKGGLGRTPAWRKDGLGRTPAGTTAAVVALALAVVTVVPARAAPKGTIRGRVVNESTGAPQPDVEVTLTSARDGGSGRRRVTTTTDERGRYVFDGLPTGDDRYYAVDARFDGGMFAGGAVRLPENTVRPPVIRSKLRVWNTTTDPAAIVLRRDSIFIVPSDDGVGVIEAVVVANVADEAYIGRGTAMGDADGGDEVPSLGFAVPAGADLPPVPIVDSDIDIPSLVATGFGVAATVAIPPGQWRVVYSYQVAGEGGTYDLSRPALYPTLEVGVYAADPLRVEGGRVTPAGTRDVRGKAYDFYSSDETLDAGDRLDMVVVAEASAANLFAIGGGIAAFAAVATSLVVLVRRRSRRPAAQPRSREELVEAIARLDLAKEQGLLPEAEWEPRRAELKRELEGAR